MHGARDGMVLPGSCDRIAPGMLMAAARLDIPAAFVDGGPMLPARSKGRHYNGNIVTETTGWMKCGEITREEFRAIENLAEPRADFRATLSAANTMRCLAEAPGI